MIIDRFASTAAKELEISVTESIAEPEPHLVRKSLLKSAFAHGKHKVQVNKNNSRDSIYRTLILDIFFT